MSSKRLIARIGSGAAPSASISTGSIASNASCPAGVRTERILPERQPSIRPRACAGAQQQVGAAKHLCRVGRDPAGRRQRGERIERRRRAQLGLAAAMDELVDLDEELDLADPAAAALEVVAGAEGLALGIMVADPPAD